MNRLSDNSKQISRQLRRRKWDVTQCIRSFSWLTKVRGRRTWQVFQWKDHIDQLTNTSTIWCVHVCVSVCTMKLLMLLADESLCLWKSSIDTRCNYFSLGLINNWYNQLSARKESFVEGDLCSLWSLALIKSFISDERCSLRCGIAAWASQPSDNILSLLPKDLVIKQICFRST